MKTCNTKTDSFPSFHLSQCDQFTVCPVDKAYSQISNKTEKKQIFFFRGWIFQVILMYIIEMWKQVRKSLNPQDCLLFIFSLALRFMAKIWNQTNLLLALLQSPSLTVGRLRSLSDFPCSHMYYIHIYFQTERNTGSINDSKALNPSLYWSVKNNRVVFMKWLLLK